MKQNILTNIFLFAFITVMQQSFSQSEKFGQMVYTAPTGWKVTKYQNSVSIEAAGLPVGEVLIIYVLKSVNYSSTLEHALERSFDEVCGMLQVTKMRETSGGNYTTLPAKKSFRGWEYIRCSGGIQVNNGTPYPAEYALDLFVIKLNGRFERVAIAKSRNNCGLSRYYPSDRRIHADAIENFLFSLRFDDWKEPVVKNGTANSEGVVGVWRGLSLSVGIAKPGAELGAELTEKQLILFSNGQAYFGKKFPVEGLHELNTWITAENNRRDWGTFSFSTGKGLLKLPYKDIPIRMTGNKLVITTNNTDHNFIKLDPVEFAKFDGTYIMDEWKGTIPSITFSTNGKFSDKGAVRVLYQEYIDCLNPAIAPGTGMYEIKNHSLIFRYDDGRKIKIGFTEASFDKKNADPSSVLSFENAVLKKY